MPRRINRIELHMNFPLRNGQNTAFAANPYIFMRSRLYRIAFSRFALLYAKIFPEVWRKIIEFSLLVISLLLFVTLVYVHIVFVQRPSACLANYENEWESSGILRIEVMRNRRRNYSLEDSYWKERTMRMQQYEASQSFFPFTSPHTKAKEETAPDEGAPEMDGEFDESEAEKDRSEKQSERKVVPVSEESIPKYIYEDPYIMEFSLEHGYLRLRHSKRRELNISVNLVILDPDTEECFGNFLDRFLLENFLGYDNIILESLKNVAQKKEQTGFVRNIVLELEYVFVMLFPTEKSYLIAGFIMFVFTLTISMLLRHSNHQIFIVIAHVLQVMFPRTRLHATGAPVLTVILALIGMEVIMSEFFNDKILANYIILIVWMADMYEAVCCHSALSKRHWFRFFYLYHYLFYAYNYKFGGVYWPLTLLTSWFFTVHSMFWFFHHYELPRILQLYAVAHAGPSNNQPPPNNSGGGPHPSPPPESYFDSDPTPPSSGTAEPENPDSHDTPGPSEQPPDSEHPPEPQSGVIEASQPTALSRKCTTCEQSDYQQCPAVGYHKTEKYIFTSKDNPQVIRNLKYYSSIDNVKISSSPPSDNLSTRQERQSCGILSSVPNGQYYNACYGRSDSICDKKDLHIYKGFRKAVVNFSITCYLQCRCCDIRHLMLLLLMLSIYFSHSRTVGNSVFSEVEPNLLRI